MNLVKSTGTFGFYTIISRLLGYFRDVLIAIFLGTSFLADSFFVAFSFSGAPLFMNEIIGEYGYSKSILIMAILFGFGMALLGWLFYRDNPEECGLLMDGGKNFQTIHALS